MEVTLTTEIFIFLGQTIGGIITIVIMWQRMSSRVEILENDMKKNSSSDKELELKVDNLEKLFSKIELLETKQNAQNENIHYSISLLNTNIEKLNNKLELFVDGYNNIRVDVESLKKNA